MLAQECELPATLLTKVEIVCESKARLPMSKELKTKTGKLIHGSRCRFPVENDGQYITSVRFLPYKKKMRNDGISFLLASNFFFKYCCMYVYRIRLVTSV